MSDILTWFNKYYPKIEQAHRNRNKVMDKTIKISTTECFELPCRNDESRFVNISNVLQLSLPDGESKLILFPPLDPLLFLPEKYSMLHECRPTENQKIKIYGKELNVPRRFAVFGSDYYFSRENHPQQTSPELLRPLLTWTSRVVGQFANPKRVLKSSDLDWSGSVKSNPVQILLNDYEAKNKEYIGSHSDDESDLEPSAIASVTWTSTPKQGRIFRIRDKKTKKMLIDLILPNQSLALMVGKNFQSRYKHEIPFLKKFDTQVDRVNLTVRNKKRLFETNDQTETSPAKRQKI